MSSFIDKLKTQLGGYFAKEEDLATIATTGDYNDLINAPQSGGGGSSEEKPPIILRFTEEQLNDYLAPYIPPAQEDIMNQLEQQIQSDPEAAEAMNNLTKKDQIMIYMIQQSFYVPESTLTYHDFRLQVHSEPDYMVKPYKIDIDYGENTTVYSLFFKNFISIDKFLSGYAELYLANNQLISGPVEQGVIILYRKKEDGTYEYTLEHDFTVDNTPVQTEK